MKVFVAYKENANVRGRVAVIMNTLLSQIRHDRYAAENLTLQWRDVYDVYVEALLSRSDKSRFFEDNSTISSILVLIRNSRRFFPKDSVGEILNDLLPFFCGHTMVMFEAKVTWWCYFFPNQLASTRRFFPS